MYQTLPKPIEYHDWYCKNCNHTEYQPDLEYSKPIVAVFCPKCHKKMVKQENQQNDNTF